jgi:hypothetical protein
MAVVHIETPWMLLPDVIELRVFILKEDFRIIRSIAVEFFEKFCCRRKLQLVSKQQIIEESINSM